MNRSDSILAALMNRSDSKKDFTGDPVVM